MNFQWELLAARGRAGYTLRVAFSKLGGERDYPVGMSRGWAEKRARLLAEQVCFAKESSAQLYGPDMTLSERIR